ncbi:MAG: AI-2E family transporter [Anaerolineales bacterium]|jgi:predicted PurR-regulated permease PerM
MKNNYQIILYITLGVGLYLLITAYKMVIGPLIIGALLAYLLYPLVIFFVKKTPLSHNQSAVIIFFLFSSLVVTALSFSTPALFKQTQALLSEFQAISDEIHNIQPVLEEALGMTLPINEALTNLEDEVGQFLNPTRMFRVIQGATANVIWVMIIFVTCYFLLKDWEKFREWIYQLFPQHLRGEVINIHKEIKLVWRSYLRGQLLMMLLIGSLSAIGGLAVGLWGAVPLGILAGGLALIPNLGPAIATATAGILALTQGSSYIDISNFWFAILVCGIYMGIQFLEGIWFQPRIMSRRMNLHPGVIIILVVSTLSLLGALAGLIVIPVVGSILVVLKHLFRPQVAMSEGDETQTSLEGELTE